MICAVREGAPAFEPALRVRAIGVSDILRITDHANALQRAGRPVIVLGAGEPDFDTPEPVRAAAARAMERLSRAPGLHCRVPEGAFYTFACCDGVLGRRTAQGVLLQTDSDGGGARQRVRAGALLSYFLCHLDDAARGGMCTHCRSMRSSGMSFSFPRKRQA